MIRGFDQKNEPLRVLFRLGMVQETRLRTIVAFPGFYGDALSRAARLELRRREALDA